MGLKLKFPICLYYSCLLACKHRKAVLKVKAPKKLTVGRWVYSTPGYLHRRWTTCISGFFQVIWDTGEQYNHSLLVSFTPDASRLSFAALNVCLFHGEGGEVAHLLLLVDVNAFTPFLPGFRGKKSKFINSSTLDGIDLLMRSGRAPPHLFPNTSPPNQTR